MQTTLSKWLLGVAMGIALMACTAAKQASPAGQTTTAADQGDSVAGWYMQHEGQVTFQACGQSEPWRIGAAADLDARAKAFGLDDDNPVYVRLQATSHAADKTIDVIRVEQFGSPTPVKNCAMDGVVLPAPTGG